MASTNMKNTMGNYNQQQRFNNNHVDYKLYKYSQIPIKSNIGGLGLNNGMMLGGYYNNILSNNASDIESQLYGISSTNLVYGNFNIKPSLNNLNEQELFKKPKLILPNKLCVEHYQRPIGPYTSYN